MYVDTPLYGQVALAGCAAAILGSVGLLLNTWDYTRMCSALSADRMSLISGSFRDPCCGYRQVDV
jgi:hypothetical protein